MIPEAAVEAAEDAVRNAMYTHGPDGHDDGYEEITRAALEAAAPYLIQAAKADAWDEGAAGGLSWDENLGEYFKTPNPYRTDK